MFSLFHDCCNKKKIILIVFSAPSSVYLEHDDDAASSSPDSTTTSEDNMFYPRGNGLTVALHCSIGNDGTDADIACLKQHFDIKSHVCPDPAKFRSNLETHVLSLIHI